MANSSESELAYIMETTAGTTPDTPEFKNLRMLSTTLDGSIETVASNAITSNRATTDNALVYKSVSGDIALELPYGEQDDMIAAVFGGSWSNDVLVNGNEKKTFTFRRVDDNGDSTKTYRVYRGVMLDTVAFNFDEKSIVTATYGALGRTSDVSGTDITGATTVAASTKSPMDTADDITILLDGQSYDIKSGSFNITNNSSAQNVLGSSTAVDIDHGSFVATISFSVYFDADVRDNLEAKANSNTAFSMSIKMGGATGDYYLFEFSKVKINNDATPNSGKNTKIMTDLTIDVFSDPDNATNPGAAITVTRLSA